MVTLLIIWVWSKGDEKDERELSNVEYDAFSQKLERETWHEGPVVAVVVVVLLVMCTELCDLLQSHGKINLLLGTTLQEVLGLKQCPSHEHSGEEMVLLDDYQSR